jgi:hypothetical protein
MPTLIQQYASSVVAGFLGRVEALRKLDHRLTKGELREMFVSEVLSSFLTSQFSVGSGIVINQAGVQSRQTDIVIYDNRLLPPFIKAERLGVFPAESVIATIEVKSNLVAAELAAAQAAALKLKNEVYDRAHSIYPQFQPWISPLCAVMGFYGRGTGALCGLDTGAPWLVNNASALDYACLTGKWSWMTVEGEWRGSLADGSAAYEETKRFIGVLLDNVRSRAESRLNAFAQQPHLDLLGVYIRDQGLFHPPEA